MVPDLSSTLTWPRGQPPPKLPTDYQTRAQINAALANLKHYTNQNNEEKVQELVENLVGVLNNRDMSQANLNRPIGVIREEPHFESMILCSKPELTRSRMNSIAYVDGIQGNALGDTRVVNDGGEELIYEEPTILRAIPHVLLYVFSVAYIGVGAEIFRLLDPEIGKLPYHTAVLLPFQITMTIGWGNIACTTAASQIFCVCYAIVGIPIVFSSLANLGRLMVDAYCADWVFLSAVVRKRRGVPERRRQLPISGAVNLLVVHQFVGVMLYNGLLDDLGIIRSLYFNIVAIAMIGFGDIAPQPKNIFESVATMVYITVGAVIISALLISLCYHFQRFYFVVVKETCSEVYERFFLKRKRSVADCCRTTSVSSKY